MRSDGPTGKGAKMASTTITQLPRTMGEIARVALAAINSMPGCVGVTVLAADGELHMTREAAEYWANKL